VSAAKLSDLLGLAAKAADDPDAVSVFVSYETPEGEVKALVHCPQGLRHLCQETILLATDAHHAPAGGVH
jgi:hypothetical protein